jgi:hypothetical protein
MPRRQHRAAVRYRHILVGRVPDQKIVERFGLGSFYYFPRYARSWRRPPTQDRISKALAKPDLP